MKTGTFMIALTTLLIHLILLMTAFTLNERRLAHEQGEAGPSYLKVSAERAN